MTVPMSMVKIKMNSCEKFFVTIATFILVTTLHASIIVAASQQEKYCHYANEFLKRHRPDLAEKVLGEGIKKNKKAFKLIYFRAKLRSDNLKNFIGAFQDYSVVIKCAGRSFPKAYYRRGDIFVRWNKLGNAIKDYNKCLKLLPGYGKVYFKRAKAFLKLGMREQAKRDLLNCVKYSPVYTRAVNEFRKKHQLW